VKFTPKSTFSLNAAVKITEYLLLVFLLVYTYSLQRQLNKLNKKLSNIAAAAPAASKVNLNIDSASPNMGTQSAKVVMTIFSDFECEFCSVFAKDVLPKIKRNYVDKGLLKVYFRFLPLDIHKDAFMAAEAATYANQQGRFWEMHDFLFNNQHKLNNALIANWIATQHLDTLKLKASLKSHTYKNKIDSDIAEAHRVGISATPAIVVNGNVSLGAHSYAYFSDLIDKELAANIHGNESAGACN
jgi:protein-disulfide isomerase